MHQEPDVYIRRFMRKEIELTPGGLHSCPVLACHERTEEAVRRPYRHAEVSRGHIKAFQGRDVEGPNVKEWLLRNLDP